MKVDVFNHEERWNRWKELITPKYIEEDLTKENSKIFLNYLFDLEQGKNIPSKSPKGGRDKKTLNRLRIKLKAILKLFQKNGVKDITKTNSDKVLEIFSKWRDQGHSNDYAKRFKALWNWWGVKNRREGKVVSDICLDLDTSANSEPPFVWLNKKELDTFLKHFNKDNQTLLLFTFDTIIRAPTELSSLKVENIIEKKGAVWLDIPKEISKTIGRKFNLVYSGKAIIEHIKRNELQPNDYLFSFSSVYLNRKMQEVAEKIFGNKKSEGGEYFKKITLYDLRHSGAIHFRQLFQKTGQSLDSLRHRGGWTDFKMLNYYSRFLGLDGEIHKDKLLVEEDKTKLEEEVESLKKNFKKRQETIQAYEELTHQQAEAIENQNSTIDLLIDRFKELAKQNQFLLKYSKIPKKVKVVNFS
jgi:integrase